MRLPRILISRLPLATLALTACTNEAQQQPQEPAAQQSSPAQQPGGVTGRAVKVAFSAPGRADHGWLKAITDNARAEAEELGFDLLLTEGTNDSASQVSQIETLIGQKNVAAVQHLGY